MTINEPAHLPIGNRRRGGAVSGTHAKDKTGRVRLVDSAIGIGRYRKGQFLLFVPSFVLCITQRGPEGINQTLPESLDPPTVSWWIPMEGAAHEKRQHSPTPTPPSPPHSSRCTVSIARNDPRHTRLQNTNSASHLVPFQQRSARRVEPSASLPPVVAKVPSIRASRPPLQRRRAWENARHPGRADVGLLVADLGCGYRPQVGP